MGHGAETQLVMSEVSNEQSAYTHNLAFGSNVLNEIIDISKSYHIVTELLIMA